MAVHLLAQLYLFSLIVAQPTAPVFTVSNAKTIKQDTTYQGNLMITSAGQLTFVNVTVRLPPGAYIIVEGRLTVINSVITVAGANATFLPCTRETAGKEPPLKAGFSYISFRGKKARGSFVNSTISHGGVPDLKARNVQVVRGAVINPFGTSRLNAAMLEVISNARLEIVGGELKNVFGHAIRLFNASLSITGTTIRNTTRNGLLLRQPIRVNVTSSNLVDICGGGISISKIGGTVPDIDVTPVIIQAVQFNRIHKNAIALRDLYSEDDTARVSAVTISDNTFSYCGHNAIDVTRGNWTVDIVRNSFDHNRGVLTCNQMNKFPWNIPYEEDPEWFSGVYDDDIDFSLFEGTKPIPSRICEPEKDLEYRQPYVIFDSNTVTKNFDSASSFVVASKMCDLGMENNVFRSNCHLAIEYDNLKVPLVLLGKECPKKCARTLRSGALMVLEESIGNIVNNTVQDNACFHTGLRIRNDNPSAALSDGELVLRDNFFSNPTAPFEVQNWGWSSVDASWNWWGFDTLAAVENRVNDLRVNSHEGIGLLSFAPFYTSPTNKSKDLDVKLLCSQIQMNASDTVLDPSNFDGTLTMRLVPRGHKLLISHVTVKFAANQWLRVEGDIVANNVTFISSSPRTFWGSIFISAASGSSLFSDCSFIQGGALQSFNDMSETDLAERAGLYVQRRTSYSAALQVILGRATVERCEFALTQGAGIATNPGSQLIVTNTRLFNGQFGIYVGPQSAYSATELVNDYDDLEDPVQDEYDMELSGVRFAEMQCSALMLSTTRATMIVLSSTFNSVPMVMYAPTVTSISSFRNSQRAAKDKDLVSIFEANTIKDSTRTSQCLNRQASVAPVLIQAGSVPIEFINNEIRSNIKHASTGGSVSGDADLLVASACRLFSGNIVTNNRGHLEISDNSFLVGGRKSVGEIIIKNNTISDNKDFSMVVASTQSSVLSIVGNDVFDNVAPARRRGSKTMTTLIEFESTGYPPAWVHVNRNKFYRNEGSTTVLTVSGLYNITMNSFINPQTTYQVVEESVSDALKNNLNYFGQPTAGKNFWNSMDYLTIKRKTFPGGQLRFMPWYDRDPLQPRNVESDRVGLGGVVPLLCYIVNTDPQTATSSDPERPTCNEKGYQPASILPDLNDEGNRYMHFVYIGIILILTIGCGVVYIRKNKELRAMMDYARLDRGDGEESAEMRANGGPKSASD